MRAPLIALLAVTFCQSPASKVPDPDPWGALRPLVGNWEGKVEGMFMQAEVEKSWEFVLEDKFLQGHARLAHDSRSVDENIGMLSWDRERECFVLRRFSSKGSVIQFVGKVQNDGSLVMESEAWENGFPYEMRAKLTLTFVSKDEIHVTHYLASGDEPFGDFVASEMKLKRADR